MVILRQNVGIDIAKDSFVATLTKMLDGLIVKHIATRKFANTQKGIDEFHQWVYKHSSNKPDVHFTMEATGVYYENLAYYLFEKEEIIHVLLPNKAKKFAESLNIKLKTDKIDSKTLGQMGVERVLKQWKLSSEIYRKMRTLTRERVQLVKDRTRVINQLHAEEHTAEALKSTVRRMKNHIRYIEKQIKSIEKELRNLVKSDNFVFEKIEKITTIPGVNFITVVNVISETQGFSNTANIKQLTSFAGYDIRIQESGAWKGKSRISKKGNSHIRASLYMPSLSAKTHSQTYGKFYDRINAKKQNGLISSTAVQRKLLGLIYTLWKNDTTYIENYQLQKKVL
jgi:transposase